MYLSAIYLASYITYVSTDVTKSIFREIPLDLFEETSRKEFQPSTNGQAVKVILQNLPQVRLIKVIIF